MQIEASTRSTNKSFKKLVADKLATPEQIYETICNQTVDLVFTAHPTQVIHGRLHTPVPSVMPGRAP
jgi:phosphoenolpyruvate carboxylase